jgi:hypothetical protein
MALFVLPLWRAGVLKYYSRISSAVIRIDPDQKTGMFFRPRAIVFGAIDHNCF